ncbi:LamB/YcsF, partial [mine drainage metagenome]
MAGFAHAAGARLRHVKAHGALYHQTTGDAALAQAFTRAVRDFDAQLAVVAQSGSALLDAAQTLHLRGLREALPIAATTMM